MATIDATGTRRRLQALSANGWSSRRLAHLLTLDPSGLRRARENRQVDRTTAFQVSELYERLWDTCPPDSTDADRREVARTRSTASARGWRPPMTWDDPDRDPEPAAVHEDGDDLILDEIAVDRAISGDLSICLNVVERLEAVRLLSKDGYSIRMISDRLEISVRTVSRLRSLLRASLAVEYT